MTSPSYLRFLKEDTSTLLRHKLNKDYAIVHSRHEILYLDCTIANVTQNLDFISEQIWQELVSLIDDENGRFI